MILVNLGVKMKMVSDTGLIVTSVISLMGMVLFFMINNSNWFKRENFKLQAATVKAENKLKMKKLEKDLGITQKKNPIQDIDIKGLISEYLGGEEEPREGSILDAIPSSVVEGFLDKIPPEKIQEILGGLANKETDNQYLS